MQKMNITDSLLDFTPEDLAVTGLTPEELKEYYAHLDVHFVDDYTIEVHAQTHDGWYAVEHDTATFERCPCMAGSHKKCKAHRKRVELVLLRRKNRRAAERKARERRDYAPLNGNRAFHIPR
jgi:hypothetical protein